MDEYESFHRYLLDLGANVLVVLALVAAVSRAAGSSVSCELKSVSWSPMPLKGGV